MPFAYVTFAHYRDQRLLGRETLTHPVIKLGSDPRSQLLVDEAARSQAVIEIGGPQAITLIDLGKEPATRVNGTPVTKRALGVGDAIEVGRSRFVLERITAAPVSNPFEIAARDRCLFPPPATPVTGYRLIQQGPDLDPDEVEERGVTSVEVVIYWGTDVLHVAHLRPPRDFVVGEETLGHRACDFFLPAEIIGGTRLPIVECRKEKVTLVVPPGARGSLTLPGQPRTPLGESRSVELPAGAKARLELGDFAIRVATVNAAKRIPTGVTTSLDWAVPSFFGLSTLVHASVIAALAFFVPPLGITEDEAVTRDRSYLVKHYLEAAALRAEEARPTEQTATALPDDHEGGTGVRALGEEGRMGSTVAKNKRGRFAIEGPKENQDVHVARDELISEASKFGIIGLLAGGIARDPDAPTAPWGRESSLGNDEVSALGNMWGDDIGASFGYGGLGLSGIGEGGGGRGEGIGLGHVGTIGHGAGTGSGQGFGAGHGRLGPGHHPAGPTLRAVGTTVLSGRLPAEVIQRIVRQNFGRFRACYEQGLGRNPNLEGRVSVRFAINRDGAVSAAANSGSDLPDSGVVECVVRAYYGLSFPAPEGGIVTVMYPIMFAPG
jgi:hypothetical protein